MEAVKMNVFPLAPLGEIRVFAWRAGNIQSSTNWVPTPLLHAGRDSRPDCLRQRSRHPRGAGIRYAWSQHAWFVGHPSWPAEKGRTERAPVGIFDPAMDPTNEKVYKFLDDLIGEMASFSPTTISTSWRRE